MDDLVGQSQAANDLESPDGLIHDRYRLLRLIGRGSQGELYLAEDLDERRTVAVKIASLGAAQAWSDRYPSSSRGSGHRQRSIRQCSP